MNDPRLSVIIPVYHHHDLAVAHVRACMANSYEPDEIIVVNDGGPLDLRDQLAALAPKMRFLYARVNEDIPWNQPGARNLGVWLSTGDVLAIEDADHVPTVGLYHAAMSALCDARFHSVRPNRRDVTLDRLSDAEFDPEHWTAPVIKAGSATRIIRRDTYTALKGFNEDFCGAYGSDDHDMKRRLATEGGCACPEGEYYLRVVDADTRNLDRLSGSGQNKLVLHEMRGRKQHDGGILRFTYTVEVLHE